MSLLVLWPVLGFLTSCLQVTNSSHWHPRKPSLPHLGLLLPFSVGSTSWGSETIHSVSRNRFFCFCFCFFPFIKKSSLTRNSLYSFLYRKQLGNASQTYVGKRKALRLLKRKRKEHISTHDERRFTATKQAGLGKFWSGDVADSLEPWEFLWLVSG